ncbi:MAG: putative Ig domain-containing protein [Planctomycetaceae bacterium]
MDEKQRTKILGGALAAVLMFGFIGPAVWKSVMAPVTDAEQKLNAANRNFDAEKEREDELLFARQNIEDAQLASLPPNVNDAQRLYQEWITNLALQCRFGRLDVKRGRQQSLPGSYNSVTVEVTGETTLEGLGRFLDLFDKADLVHRIDHLSIESTGSQGNPQMEVTLTANGLSVDGTPARLELFARSSITEAVSADATQLVVSNSDAFPKKPPFLARIGTEMLRVTSSADGNWTVERGVEGSKAVAHAAEAVIQHFPVAWKRRDDSFEQYASLLAASPFVKPAAPRTYSPKIAAVADTTIAPGDEVSMTARIDDLNTAIGEPAFALETGVEGMAIDPVSGEIKWKSPEDVAPGEYKATVLATQKNNDQLSLSKEFTVTIKLPNESPSLKVPSEAVVVINREFILTVVAEDDGPADKLSFAFEGDAVPEGLAIDATSGTMKWQPPVTFTPGDYTVQVKVTDSGDPAKSASESLTLKVKDDSAVMTYLTGAVSKDGVMEAWFYNRGTNKHDKLHVGQRLKIDEMDTEIVEIDKRAVCFRDEKGLWILALGKNLRERELVEAAPTTDVAAEAVAPSTNTGAGYDDDPPKKSDNAEAYRRLPPDAVDARASEGSPAT